jgi:hypothetical protein
MPTAAANETIVIYSSEDERAKYNAAREARRRAKKDARALLKAKSRQTQQQQASSSDIVQLSSSSASSASESLLSTSSSLGKGLLGSGLVSTAPSQPPLLSSNGATATTTTDVSSGGTGDSSFELPPPLDWGHMLNKDAPHPPPPTPAKKSSLSGLLSLSVEDSTTAGRTGEEVVEEQVDGRSLEISDRFDSRSNKSASENENGNVEEEDVESPRKVFARDMLKFKYNGSLSRGNSSSSKSSSSDSLPSLRNSLSSRRQSPPSATVTVDTSSTTTTAAATRRKPKTQHSIPSAYLAVLDTCPVCNVSWTTKKTSMAKERHVLGCAPNGRPFSLELVQELVEDAVREKQAAAVAAAAGANQTVFEETVARRGVEVCVVGVEEGSGGGDCDQVQKDIELARKKSRKQQQVVLPKTLARAVRELEKRPPRTEEEETENQADALERRAIRRMEHDEEDYVSAMPPATQPFAPSRVAARRTAGPGIGVDDGGPTTGAGGDGGESSVVASSSSCHDHESRGWQQCEDTEVLGAVVSGLSLVARLPRLTDANQS